MLPWQHFCQGALGQKFQFFFKNGLFLLQNVFISEFLARIRNQRLRIDPCAKFQLHSTKDKGARILTWNDTENCLMTLYLPPGDDVSKFLWLLRDFVPEYHHAKFGCNWTTNKRETEGGTTPPAYMVSKDSSLVGLNWHGTMKCRFKGGLRTQFCPLWRLFDVFVRPPPLSCKHLVKIYVTE